MKIGRWLLAPLALRLLVGCESTPRPVEFDTTAQHAETADGLRRVRASRVGAPWLRPGASFAGYDAVLFDPVSVSYKSPPRPATSADRPHRGGDDHREGDRRLVRSASLDQA
jgi:hypothetical protein